MHRDGRSERVLRAIEASVSGDTSSMAELFTEDIEASSPTVSVSSRVELAVELEDQDDAFSECRVTLRGVTVAEFDGDRICAMRQYWHEARLLPEPGPLPED